MKNKRTKKEEYWVPVFINKKSKIKHYDNNGNLTGYSKGKSLSMGKVILYLFTFMWVPAVLLYLVKWIFAAIWNLYVFVNNWIVDNFVKEENDGDRN